MTERPLFPTGRFLTLETRDPRLPALLNGESGEPSLRPLLLTTLNPGLLEGGGEWTFEFVAIDQIQAPHWSIVWIKALRPDTLVLSMGPILATFGWLVGWMQTQSLPLELSRVVLAILGVLALHASVNLFNDYHDYRRGWDRVAQRGGSRVISRGWLAASAVQRAAWGAFFVSVLFGLPVVLTHFSPGGLIALLAGLAALEFAVGKFGLKYKGFAEIAAWFMFGPMLTGGFVWAVTGRMPWQGLAIGTVFGSLALLTIHLKNFERILVDGQARLMTWPVRAGFDASKTFTYFCVALVFSSLAFIAVLVDPVFVRVLPLVAVSAAAGPLLARVKQLESPVGGKLRGLHAVGLRLAWITLISFVVGDCLRFALVKS